MTSKSTAPTVPLCFVIVLDKIQGEYKKVPLRYFSLKMRQNVFIYSNRHTEQ